MRRYIHVFFFMFKTTSRVFSIAKHEINARWMATTSPPKLSEAELQSTDLYLQAIEQWDKSNFHGAEVLPLKLILLVTFSEKHRDYANC